MNIRIYIKDGRQEDFHDVHSIAHVDESYYIEFLDGTTVKLSEHAVGEIQVRS